MAQIRNLDRIFNYVKTKKKAMTLYFTVANLEQNTGQLGKLLKDKKALNALTLEIIKVNIDLLMPEFNNHNTILGQEQYIVTILGFYKPKLNESILAVTNDVGRTLFASYKRDAIYKTYVLNRFDLQIILSGIYNGCAFTTLKDAKQFLCNRQNALLNQAIINVNKRINAYKLRVINKPNTNVQNLNTIIKLSKKHIFQLRNLNLNDNIRNMRYASLSEA